MQKARRLVATLHTVIIVGSEVVSYSISCSTVGTDYVSFAPVNLVYHGGSRQEDLIEFNITIIDDDIPEPIESFEISGLATRNLYFPFPVMTVTILDNECKLQRI